MYISRPGEGQSCISIMGVCQSGKEKTMNEYAIEWTKDRDYAGVTVPSGTAWKTKLLRYAESHPEDVKVIAVNEDGSAFFMYQLPGLNAVLQGRFQRSSG